MVGPAPLPPGSFAAGPAGALARAWQATDAARLLFASADVDDVRDQVGRVFRPHRLEPERASAAVAARMHHLPIATVSLNRLCYGADVRIDPGPLGDFYLLQIPLRGQAEIRSGSHRFCSDPHTASLLSPTPDLSMHWQADCDQICVRFDAQDLRRLCESWTGASIDGPPRFEPRFEMERHGHTIEILCTLLQLARHSAADSPYTLSVVQLEHSLLASLLRAQPSSASESLSRAAPPLAPRHVRRVEEFLVARPDAPITPESLAQLAGVSVRSLFLGFQRYRGIGPMQFLRELRMRKVREALLFATPGSRVTDVALRWGFAHLGRFSVEYRQRFGESPSDTLHRRPDPRPTRTPGR